MPAGQTGEAAMTHFILSEANALLPTIVPKLVSIRDFYERSEGFRDDSRAAAAASAFGGGMEGGTSYVEALYKIGKLTTELHEMGVELKDHTRGLIDFPSLRGDRVILLC